jgi:FlaA1/EpsC-like NDP-sugar epimerase
VDQTVSTGEVVSGRRVLVTGAAGSIGLALCAQLLDYGPARLAGVDISDTGLSNLRRELEKHTQAAACSFHVADVTDQESNARLFSEIRPEIVFHAAAHKHIPMMESNVCRAVKNNVFGLLAVARAAEVCGASSLIMVSSDKAVNPISVIGVTKRIGEIYLAAKPFAGMRCISVRFGNVLGSSGSVLLIWTRQLRDGEPLTITHPEAERYFMRTSEATGLLLQAAAVGQHGDILVFEMGEPVPILRLARSLIQQAGKTEGQVAIRYIGLREGEKLKEQLFYQGEEGDATSSPTIKRARLVRHDWERLSQQLSDLERSMALDGGAEIKAKMKAIVPQYSYTDRVQTAACISTE